MREGEEIKRKKGRQINSKRRVKRKKKSKAKHKGNQAHKNDLRRNFLEQKLKKLQNREASEAIGRRISQFLKIIKLLECILKTIRFLFR